MPPVRRAESRPSRPSELFLPSADDPGTEPARDPEDLARVAVGLMLERALAAIGASFEIVGRDGTVCSVLVPAHVQRSSQCTGWAEIVREEWRIRARGGEHCNGRGAGRSWTDPQTGRAGSRGWVS